MRALPALFAILAALPGPVRQEADRPNVVFLLADDLGYGDLACTGHPCARTPHLDRLAREGTRFEQFTVTGVTCCPSRTGFMTSRFPARFAKYPADSGFGDRVTVTELLKRAGYATGHFGKWHIGPDPKPGAYGIAAVASGDGVGRRKAEGGRDEPVYDAAIAFIEANRARPFYVNVWGHSTHHPVDPPAAYRDRFKDVPIREEDFPAPMREKFALVRARGGDPAAAMRAYLGDVSALDDNVGRLLQRLDDLGLRERTIVVFTSDHGSSSPRPPGEEPKRKKEGAGGDDVRLNLMGHNGGLRGGKHGMYEGGVRVPFIVRWPGRVPAGRVDRTSVLSGIDWLPTVCALAGAAGVPADLDGEDVSKAWLGGEHARSKPLFWKTSNPRADVGLRDGRWKLHWSARKRGETELYDVAADPGETRNLAADHPDVVRALVAKVEAWNAALPAEYEKILDRDD
jgi:N-acetylgalactosamine-6-sulfatase